MKSQFQWPSNFPLFKLPIRAPESDILHFCYFEQQSQKATSSKFGVKAGAQTYRSIMDNSWHTQPMVVPYFRLGGNDIGIDVGGILYNIFVNANGGKRSNPTIAPPGLKDMH